jgi:VRR-NUC domain
MSENRLTEHQEQCLTISFCNSQSLTDRRFGMIFAIPNGTWAKNIGAARKAKSEGVKKGVPDLFLPVPTSESHGLFLEMKRTGASTTSVEQKQWLKELQAQGYTCKVCKGHREAIAAIQDYLKVGAIEANIVDTNPENTSNANSTCQDYH